MKKRFALLLALVTAMCMILAACSGSDTAEENAVVEEEEAAAEEEEVAEAEEEEEAAEAEEVAEAGEAAEEEEAGEAEEIAVMTYEEYVAADLDTEVVIETYVQAKQSWWDDKATVYTQDEDGAYFLYDMTCSEEDYELLEPGTMICVTGYKSEWSGEVEIIDATFEFIEGSSYVAEPFDVTDIMADESLIDYQNQLVSFTGMTVEASEDADGNEAAFLYNWDGSGEAGSNCDLYFNVSVDDEIYTFTVESYLCDEDTDVYQAVTELQIGDVIDMEGFLYWYNGVNPHITSVTVTAEAE